MQGRESSTRKRRAHDGRRSISAESRRSKHSGKRSNRGTGYRKLNERDEVEMSSIGNKSQLNLDNLLSA